MNGPRSTVPEYTGKHRRDSGPGVLPPAWGGRTESYARAESYGRLVVDSRPAIPAERLQNMHRRGDRGPMRHETLDSALKSFRLLPRETVADPRLLAHLARAGITEREGRFLYRFDPACNGRRRPTDGWALLDRITAPTLLVRGEHSPILPREMAADMLARLAHARLVEIPGTYHHLVLDAPGAFARALEDFLSQPIPST